MKHRLSNEEISALRRLRDEHALSYQKFSHRSKRWSRRPPRAVYAKLARAKLCDEASETAGIHQRVTRYVYTPNQAGDDAVGAELCRRELEA